jgi:hypothetical protein
VRILCDGLGAGHGSQAVKLEKRDHDSSRQLYQTVVATAGRATWSLQRESLEGALGKILKEWILDGEW